jgi:hypothetical protein
MTSRVDAASTQERSAVAGAGGVTLEAAGVIGAAIGIVLEVLVFPRRDERRALWATEDARRSV